MRSASAPGRPLEHLEQLRAAGWRLGVVTDGLAVTQTAVLEHTGLAGHLDGRGISQAEGIRKPDPAIFVRSAGRCDAGLKCAWMVGDSGWADIGGAQRAGLCTIWLRRRNVWPTGLMAPYG